MKFTFDPSDIKARESGPNGRYLAVHPDPDQPELLGVSVVAAKGGQVAAVWLERDVLVSWAAAVAAQYSRPVPAEDDEDDEDNYSPHEGDGFVTLDRGRYYVSLGGANGIEPDDEYARRRGYPDPDAAVYELAALMAEHGSFPAAWMEGEHGPSSRNIDDEVRAFHDEGGTRMLPLPGVEHEPGDEVRYNGSTMEVIRDYGELGIWLAVASDRSAGEAFVRDRSLVLRTYEPGHAIEYLSPDGGEWLPCVFVGDLDEDPDSGTVVASALTARGPGLPGLIRRAETRLVSRELITAARGWIAECEWADIGGEDDIADLNDAQVITGIQRHFPDGWAGFRRAGA